MKLLELCILFGCIFGATSQGARTETPRCQPTSQDILGPYYYPNAPRRQQICGKDPYYRQWDHLLVEGRVYTDDCRTPLPGAQIEVWQADHEGHYLFRTNCRGYLTTGRTGYYAFLTIHPGKYSIDPAGNQFRPAHIHFRVESPGHKILVTQMYFKGDSNLGRNDSCTACGSWQMDLVKEPHTVCTSDNGKRCLDVITFDIVLQRGRGPAVNMDVNDVPVEVYDAVEQG